MDLMLKDSTVLVTAASRGLGFSVAKALVNEGARVIICGRTEKTLEEASSKLGQNAEYRVADVSKPDDIKGLMKSLDHLDGLFVNAGGPSPGEFSDLSDSDWEHAFELTLMSAVRLTREAIPLLKKAEHPSILYSTSISVKQPINNLLLSNSLRPAVIGMMRTLSEEVAAVGIRVNAVCPGYINTQRVEELMAKSKTKESDPMKAITSRIPLGRMGHPDEFGVTCAFLLSPIASYIHGSLLLIDGGLYKGMM
jgi:3-oxoacyl-[acyl-carrier protein] reductase